MVWSGWPCPGTRCGSVSPARAVVRGVRTQITTGLDVPWAAPQDEGRQDLEEWTASGGQGRGGPGVESFEGEDSGDVVWRVRRCSTTTTVHPQTSTSTRRHSPQPQHGHSPYHILLDILLSKSVSKWVRREFIQWLKCDISNALIVSNANDTRYRDLYQKLGRPSVGE